MFWILYLRAGITIQQTANIIKLNINQKHNTKTQLPYHGSSTTDNLETATKSEKSENLERCCIQTNRVSSSGIFYTAYNILMKFSECLVGTL